MKRILIIAALVAVAFGVLGTPAYADEQTGLPDPGIKWRIQAAFLNGKLEVDFGWASMRRDLSSSLMEEAVGSIVWSPIWRHRSADPQLRKQKRFMRNCYNVGMLGLAGDHWRLFSDLATDQSVRAVERTRELWTTPLWIEVPAP